MQCIPVSKPIHPAAGARHFTRHHCHARAFLFHSQTAEDIPSVVNGRWAADIIGADSRTCANNASRTCRSRLWQLSSLWLDHTSLISCARLSCFWRIVYFFILKFSLVISREFSIMSIASGGFAPDPHHRPPVPHPLYENPGSATGRWHCVIPYGKWHSIAVSWGTLQLHGTFTLYNQNLILTWFNLRPSACIGPQSDAILSCLVGLYTQTNIEKSSCNIYQQSHSPDHCHQWTVLAWCCRPSYPASQWNRRQRDEQQQAAVRTRRLLSP